MTRDPFLYTPQSIPYIGLKLMLFIVETFLEFLIRKYC